MVLLLALLCGLLGVGAFLDGGTVFVHQLVKIGDNAVGPSSARRPSEPDPYQSCSLPVCPTLKSDTHIYFIFFVCSLFADKRVASTALWREVLGRGLLRADKATL